MVKFLHMADLHLGYKQYNSYERFVDFNKAFKAALDVAVKDAVDFVLICGDMFNDARASAEVMFAVHDILARFKQACAATLGRDVPVIAIEGNHDMSGYHSERSWMQFLANIGMIVLLTGYRASDTIVFKQWRPGETRPGFIDVGDARVYGLPFQGAMTKDVFPLLPPAIDHAGDRFTILAMHFGIAQELAAKQGIDFGERGLAELREAVDYLALGHFHKKYALPMNEPWIWNPGSLETVDVTDQEYPRGFFVIETRGKRVTPTFYVASNGPADPAVPSYPTRAFVSGHVPLVGDARRSFEATRQLVVDNVKRRYPSLQPRGQPDEAAFLDPAVPVVNVRLAGSIEYPSRELDLKGIEQHLKENYLVLDAKVYNQNLRSALDDFQVPESDKASIASIERSVFARMMQEHDLVKDSPDAAVDLIIDLKHDLMSGGVDPVVVKDKIASWWYTFVKPDKQEQDRIAARLFEGGVAVAPTRDKPATGARTVAADSVLDIESDPAGLDDEDDFDDDMEA